MARKIKQNKYSLAVTLLLISLFWFAKNILFVHALSLETNILYVGTSSIGVGLIVGSMVAYKTSPFKMMISLLIYCILTFILYADVVYERYYDAILDFKTLSQTNQAGDVYDSIISLIYLTDLWYWLDIPLLLVALILLNKRHSLKKLKYLPPLLFLTGVAIIIFLSFTTLKPAYSDQYKVATAGVIPAHVYNAYTSIKPVEEPVVVASSQAVDEPVTIQEKFSFKQKLQKNAPNFGKYKGKNLIIVQAESLNEFVINLKVDGEEVTPVMNELLDTSNYYPNTYLQIGRGNTSDAEFVVNNSIYPMSDNGVYQRYPKNNFLSLANVLKEEGYETSATHGNKPDFWNRKAAYPNQGFDTFYHMDHKSIKQDEMIGMGISDESMFHQMVEQYKGMKKPFYNFIVSLTTHRPFELPTEYRKLDLPDHIKDTPTGNYLESVYYFDQALGSFITDLKANHLWDDTIFIVYGDHYGPVPKDAEEIKEFLDIDFDEEERFNIPLIIHHPDQKKAVRNEVIASQMDIYPTISQLMGITKPLVQFGTSLELDQPRYVGFYYETTPYSFYSKDYDYIASHTGVFEDGKCIRKTSGNSVNINYCQDDYKQLYSDVQLSRYLLEHNMIDKVYEIEDY
ncbi:LTA synthase family protein [Rossellomorea vietnamensis]|uniref:LTA synthase family protein n=1 Tax=Rossellomorea vietnamensis TaxID=218284 RepID=UPI003D26F6E7